MLHWLACCCGKGCTLGPQCPNLSRRNQHNWWLIQLEGLTLNTACSWRGPHAYSSSPISAAPGQADAVYGIHDEAYYWLEARSGCFWHEFFTIDANSVRHNSCGCVPPNNQWPKNANVFRVGDGGIYVNIEPIAGEPDPGPVVTLDIPTIFAGSTPFLGLGIKHTLDNTIDPTDACVEQRIVHAVGGRAYATPLCIEDRYCPHCRQDIYPDDYEINVTLTLSGIQSIAHEGGGAGTGTGHTDQIGIGGGVATTVVDWPLTTRGQPDPSNAWNRTFSRTVPANQILATCGAASFNASDSGGVTVQAVGANGRRTPRFNANNSLWTAVVRKITQTEWTVVVTMDRFDDFVFASNHEPAILAFAGKATVPTGDCIVNFSCSNTYADPTHLQNFVRVGQNGTATLTMEAA